MGTILVCLIMIGGGYSMYRIMKIAEKIFTTIRDIETRANATNDLTELEGLWDELITISKESFHKTTGARVKEVAVMLKTKYKVLKEVQGK